MSKVFDSSIAFREVVEKGRAVLHTTPSGRQEVIAKLYEGDREVYVLTIQNYRAGTPSGHAHFSFVGTQISRLMDFLDSLRSLPIASEGAFSIKDAELHKHNLTIDDARRILAGNSELISQIIENDVSLGDITALGYRRSELKRFERMLGDKDCIEEERRRLDVRRPEDVWQAFFEANKWIFGFGLSLVMLGPLEGRSLEQVVQGASLGGVGKRADAVMKTRGIVSSLCFVEIKRHDTRLLREEQYRSGVFIPSSEVTGAIAQSQATVHAALTNLGERLDAIDRQGNPTGEILFGIKPRSYVVVGNLDEFQGEHGVNQAKYRSFELYRRSLREPEIVTFDELYHRAKYIVDHSS